MNKEYKDIIGSKFFILGFKNEELENKFFTMSKDISKISDKDIEECFNLMEANDVEPDHLMCRFYKLLYYKDKAKLDKVLAIYDTKYPQQDKKPEESKDEKDKKPEVSGKQDKKPEVDSKDEQKGKKPEGSGRQEKKDDSKATYGFNPTAFVNHDPIVEEAVKPKEEPAPVVQNSFPNLFNVAMNMMNNGVRTQQAPPVQQVNIPADKSNPEDPEPKMSLGDKVKLISKSIKLIKGTHPGFKASQINSLIYLQRSKYAKKKLSEFGCKPNKDGDFILQEIAMPEGDADTNRFDMAFRVKTDDPKHPALVLYNTNARWIEKKQRWSNDISVELMHSH